MGKNTATYTYDTFSDLRLTTGDSGASVTVLGASSINDGNGGRFYYDPTSTASDDGINVIQPIPISGAGRWLRSTPLVTKADIGLSNVDNTSDADKPVSTAQATSIANAILTANNYTDDQVSAVLGADFGGSVVPTSNPAPTGKAFYLATQPGTYTNMGSVVVNANSFAVISYDGVSAWSISQSTLDVVSHAEFDPIEEKVNQLFESVFVSSDINIQEYNGTSLTQWANNSFARIGFGIPLSSGQTVDKLHISARLADNCDTFKCLIYTRLSSDSASTIFPGGLAGDVLKETVTLTSGTDFIPSGDPLIGVDVTFPFQKISYDPTAPIVLAYLKPYTDAGATRTTLGLQRVDSASNINPAYIRGWNIGPSTTNDTSGTIVSTATVTFDRLFTFTGYEDNVAKSNNAIFDVQTKDLQNYSTGINYFLPTQFARIGFGYALNPEEVLNKIIVNGISLVSDNSRTEAWIYKRLSTESNSTLGPGLATGDVLLEKSIKYAGVDYAVPATGINLEFNLSEIDYDPAANIIVVVIKVYKADNSRSTLTVKYGDVSTISEPYVRGWNVSSATSNDISMTFNSSDSQTWNRIFHGISTINRITQAEEEIEELQQTKFVPPSYNDRVSLTKEVTGMSVNISGKISSIDISEQFSGILTISASTIGTAVINNYSLIYSTSAIWANMPGAFLGYRGINNVSAVKSSDSSPIVENIDYFVNTNGKLGGIINTSSYNINVTFNYQAVRYDIIQLNRATLSLSVKQGQNRYMDTVEYKPTPDTGCIELCTIRVQGNNLQVIDTYLYKDMIRLDSEQDFQQLISYNKKCLPKLYGKIARGETISVAGYGDSITAIQLSGSVPYTANGANRDRPSYYLRYYPIDTISSLPLYDFGDGAGTVHTKLQFNWQLINQLGLITNTAAKYLNFGIGSTTTQNTIDNGLYPSRIAEVVNSDADVVIIEFGMNELGQTYTLPNIINMVGQFKAVGKECIIVGVPFVNTERAANINWLKTNRYLYQAAVETQSAFVPLHWITLNNLGSLGISQDDFCGTNVYNHPGILEHKKYGELLIKSLEL